jgi:uncharacterized protein (TIGR03663 family)
VRRWANSWEAECWFVLFAAAVLRLYDLSLKPLHHDEGVNAYFFARLFRQGIYHYDPANYHGPTLYYFALLISSVVEIFSKPNQLSTLAIRLVPGFFGIGIIALLLSLRNRIGEIGALSAATLVAVSPGAVYFSRDFIHEMLLVFFELAVPIALLRYHETHKSSYLVLASSSAALMFATKETAAMSAVVLVLALLMTFLYSRHGVWANLEGPESDSRTSLLRSKRLSRVLLLGLLSTVVFGGLYALLYSSFFADPNGIRHSIETFHYWLKTGSQQHRAAWYTYVRWMLQAELPVLLLGIVGTVLAASHPRDRFALFAGLWAWGSLAAYSLLPYKTPWLMLNFIVPMAIIGGYAVQTVWDWRQRAVNRAPAEVILVVILLGVLGSLAQSISLNFFRYDDPHLPYVYMQTNRALISLVQQINLIAAQSGFGRQTPIIVTSRDYWPLPWYLRDYASVGYSGQVLPTNAKIIVASETQEKELISLVANNYRRVGSYPLRPSVTLVVYVQDVP